MVYNLTSKQLIKLSILYGVIGVILYVIYKTFNLRMLGYISKIIIAAGIFILAIANLKDDKKDDKKDAKEEYPELTNDTDSSWSYNNKRSSC